uniref:DUF4218 domain-containing protein n=1 Tax=Tanacetum cinerariifolium TaxID=118510 RepID=A0A6L2JY89_TANCI|nr:hypothetical protein [Tanacetum cinerariifolium]
MQLENVLTTCIDSSRYTNWSDHWEDSVPSQPFRPTFGEDDIRSLVHDDLSHLPSDSPVANDLMFEDNVGEFSQSSHSGVEDESDSMFKDNVGESSQSSHCRVEDENVGKSFKTSDDSATYKKLLEEYTRKDQTSCHVCKDSQYKSDTGDDIAKDMRWHNMGQIMDGKLRHPTDGLAWKGFDTRLCAKVLDLDELDKLESQIALTLCDIEKLFPPSFITFIVHLTIHLISEAKLGGHVHYKWMYPIERYLMRLKSYVRNKAQPEGSIAEGYIKDECLTFCSRYFKGVETLFNRPPRNDEHVLEKEMYILNSGGRKLGKIKIIELDHKSLAQAHRYVPFFKKIKFDEEVVSLASGPGTIAKHYNGIITNGYRFLTRIREEFKKTQNLGVIVEVEGGNYYGKLSNIIELEYFGGYKVMLFHCDWVDIYLQKG